MKKGRMRRAVRNCRLIFVLIFAAAGATCGQNKFQIDIEIENLKKPAKVILTVREVGHWVDYTAESKGTHFTLTGVVAEPSFAYLVMKYKSEADKSPHMGNVTQLYIDNVNISVNAKD